MKKEIIFAPFTLLPKLCEQGNRWIVHVTVTHPQTGKALRVSRHECRDRLHAATLLSEVRELAEDLTEFLPGLGAEGYELLHTALVLPSFIEAVADGTVNVDDEAYWRTGLKPSISQEDA